MATASIDATGVIRPIVAQGLMQMTSEKCLLGTSAEDAYYFF